MLPATAFTCILKYFLQPLDVIDHRVLHLSLILLQRIFSLSPAVVIDNPRNKKNGITIMRAIDGLNVMYLSDKLKGEDLVSVCNMDFGFCDSFSAAAPCGNVLARECCEMVLKQQMAEQKEAGVGSSKKATPTSTDSSLCNAMAAVGLVARQILKHEKWFLRKACMKLNI